jgi:hypothetical protein
MNDIKALTYSQPLFRPAERPLARHIDRLSLLRRSNVDFIPIDGAGRTIRTSPLLEDNVVSWREKYIEAALIYITNPLFFAAQNLINDEVANARIIVEEKQTSTKWKEHENNELANWLPHPNQNMDIKEFFRAYATHYHTFGAVYAYMFQPNDILPNGKINQEQNCFDIIFPGRLYEDTLSNPYGFNWHYLPVGYENAFILNNESMFMDVVYNPIAHNLGISYPNSPLGMVSKIHDLYLKNIDKFFTKDAIPTHLLTRIVDIQKDANSMSITDDEIESAIQRIYSRVGRGGSRPAGWLGLRGDWRVNRLGSPLPELFNKDLLHYLESLVASVYKVPASLFGSGIESGGQRASRQQDSIDFFNMKIHPFLERICSRLSNVLVPMFLGDKKKKTFRIGVDLSEMPLAQYAVQKQYRMYERWYQLKLIQRERFLTYVNEPTDHLTECEKKEWFSGGNAGNSLTIGKGEQSIEKENALE